MSVHSGPVNHNAGHKIFNSPNLPAAKADQGRLGLGVEAQVRSGMGAYGETALRRVHLVKVLLRPPSGHSPGRRQARHARILQIGLRLAIVQADARPVMSISFR